MDANEFVGLLESLDFGFEVNTSQDERLSLIKRGLMAWAEGENISPAEFEKKMEYSYNHAYQLLRGNSPVTYETLGRFFLNYGGDMLIKLSSYVREVNGSHEESLAQEAGE